MKDTHTERSQLHKCLYISLTEFAVIPTIINSYYYYCYYYYYCNLRRVTCNLQPATCKLHPPVKQPYLAWNYLVAFHPKNEKRKYSLTLDNFSLSSQQLVPNYFLYSSKSSDVHLREILAQFWPNKYSSATRRHLVMVETHPKSWNRRTAENYSRSIVMLLTLNQLHFSWSYWLPKCVTLHMQWHKGCCSNSIHKN